METDDLYGFRAGILAGYGHGQTRVGDRSSLADIDSYTLGAYASRNEGALRALFSAAYTLSSIDRERNVTFPGFTDMVTASYLSSTYQAFGEIGYVLGTPQAQVEPFAGLALVNVQTQGFTETGAAAALQVDAASQTLGVSTLGVRANGEFGTDATGTVYSWNGSLAWKHTIGDVTPLAQSHFASGGQAFTVAGTPIDQDTAQIEAGLKLDFAGPTDLNLTYRGELGQSTLNNTLSARLSGTF